MNFLIDTHCHIDFDSFDEDRSETVNRAESANIRYLINIGCDEHSNQRAYNNSLRFQNVFFSAGIHPSDVDKSDDSIFNQIRHLASHPKMLAVGEIGLDYYKYDTDRNRQKYFFIQSLDLAYELKKPVIIHNRDAHNDVADILRTHPIVDIGAVLHCFSGNKEQVKMFLDLNCFISFTGVITFKNSNYDDIIRMVPKDRIMIETDSPFLTPHPFRGRRNEPSYLPLIAKKIADVYGFSEDEFIEISSQNAIRFFHIPIDSV